MKPPVLLCYNLPDGLAASVRLLSMRLTVRVRPVRPEEFGETLSALCGLTPTINAVPPAETFSEEMLVLCHFDSDRLQKFLNAYRQAKIPTITLKAVLTQTNAGWDSVLLHRHLSEERDAMSRASSSTDATPDGGGSSPQA